MRSWRRVPSVCSSGDPRCLSQWYPSPFTVDDILYRTAEHFMMVERAGNFGDDEKLAEILAAAKAPQVSIPWRHENPFKTIWGTKIWGTYLHHEQHVPAKQRCMYFQLRPSVHSSHLNKQKTESACSTSHTYQRGNIRSSFPARVFTIS